MKFKIIALLLLVIACGAFTKSQAQIEIQAGNKTYSEVFDSLNTGLIPSRIPYGNLYNRVYPWTSLDTWKNNDTTSINKLYQSWYDAEQSIIDVNNRPNRYEPMRNAVQQLIYQVNLPIININYRFSCFDSMALIDGRLGMNNGMLVDNNLGSPYFTKQITMAGIGVDKVMANKAYALKQDTALLLNNTNILVTSIIVSNETTGENFPLVNNISPSPIYFTIVGINVLKFTTTYSDGTSKANYQKINVISNNSNVGTSSRPDGPSCKPENIIIESAIPFKGYIETIATNSFADYHIYYHTVNPTGTDNCQIGGVRKLLKPIIIMDGFDPQDENKYFNIYEENLSYGDINNKIRLGDELRDKGYDVIILNFPKLGSDIEGMPNKVPRLVKVNGSSQLIDKLDRDGGTDYMERNAFILVKLIQEVNATLQANSSAEKLVVIGPSMGGQISRYALAYMEKQNSLGVPDMNHNTRLFLSFDSPNDGANIPIALQQNLYFFGFIGQNEAAKKNYRERLNSIAARQLLIEQNDGLNSTANFHQTFFNNIRNGGLPNSGGYPINLRKVTLLNGAGNSSQTYSPGVEVLNMHGIAKLPITGTVIAFKAEDNFMPAFGQTAQTSNNRIVYEYKLGQIFNTSINLPIFLNGKYNTPNYNNKGCMDALQGSTFKATKVVYEGFSKGLKEKEIAENLFNLQPFHCFIPSVSALAFKNNNFNWNDNVVNRNLLCNNEIWYDNYFIPKTNEQHITLTTENVEWIAQEIDKGQPNCPKICSFSLNGSYNVCINTNATFTLDVPAPAGCTVVCDPSPYYQIIGTSSTGVVIKPILAGAFSITVRIVNPCGANVVLKKDLYVGAVTNVTTSYVMVHCNVVKYKWTVDGAIGATQYRWSYRNITSPTPFTVFKNGSANWATSPFGDASCDQIEVKVEAIYPCSLTSPSTFTFMSDMCPPYSDGSCSYGRTLLASPSPSASSVQLKLVDEPNVVPANTQPKKIKQVRVVDKMGQIKQSYTGNDLDIMVINLSSLPTDIYTILVSDGKVWMSKQVSKN
jgi:hypothetical protein